MSTPLTRPTARDAPIPAAIPTHTAWPALSTTPVTIAARQRIEPTDRSMPPVMITAVIPMATMATKAKLRVTLKRFCGVAKALVANDRTTAASRAAVSTQKAWRPSARLTTPWLLASMARWRSPDIDPFIGLPSDRGSSAFHPTGDRLVHWFSCGDDGAGDEPGHLLGAGRGHGLVGHLGPAAQHHDAIGHREHVGHAMADQDHGDALVAQPAHQVQHLGDLAHGDGGGGLGHQHDRWCGEPCGGDGRRLALAARPGRPGGARAGLPLRP